MSTSATALRPAPYLAVRYEAFRVSGNQTARLAIGECGSLSAAVEAAQVACLHREQLLIRETGDDGAVRLHIFTIRKRAPRWVTPSGEFVPRRVEDLFAEQVCVVDGRVLGS